MTPTQRRGAALGISVGLHLVVLGAVVFAVHEGASSTVKPAKVAGARASVSSVTQMRVRFDGRSSALKLPAPLTSSEAPAKSSGVPKHRQAETVVAPSGEPGETEEAGLVAVAAESEDASTEAGSSGGAVSPVSGKPTGGAGSASQSGDALLAQLQAKLADAARRCYPHEAERFRLQGHVPLAFCLNASGAPQTTSLQGSTGSPILDRAAKDCVVPSAVPLPPRAGCYTVTVQFGGQG